MAKADLMAAIAGAPENTRIRVGPSDDVMRDGTRPYTGPMPTLEEIRALPLGLECFQCGYRQEIDPHCLVQATISEPKLRPCPSCSNRNLILVSG